MKIGIIGLGVVGSACKFGFELLGHEVVHHDIKFGTTIHEVLDTRIVYVCVPTAMKEDGACDTTVVESVIDDLAAHNYKGVVAIKSTVVPGTTEDLIDKTRMNIAFVPEFLRERCAITDFTENHDVCIIGAQDDATYALIKKCHGDLPEKFVQLEPTEAEFCKYFNNVYNAMLVVFANSFYEACQHKNVNYKKVKDAVVKRKHIANNYLECNANFRGFGGMCLPKDLHALAAMLKNTNVDFFEDLIKENGKYEVTVFQGMRK